MPPPTRNAIDKRLGKTISKQFQDTEKENVSILPQNSNNKVLKSL